MAETSSNAARTATMIIATIMVGAVIWWMRNILTPFALALFLMVVIDGLARVLEHRIPHFPKKAALPTVCGASIRSSPDMRTTRSRSRGM